MRILQIRDYQVNIVNKSKFWKINPDVLKIIEENEKHNHNKLLLEMTQLLKCSKGDANNYIKKLLIWPIAKKLYIRKHLESTHKNKTCLIITDDNTYGLFDNLGIIFEEKCIFNSMLSFLAIVAATLVVLWIALSKFKLIWKRQTMPKNDLLVHVNQFGYEKNMKKEYRPEDYVYDKKKVSLFITDAWRPTKDEQLEKYKEHLKNHGISYLDVKNFSIEPSELIHFITLSVKSSFRANGAIRSWHELYMYFAFLYHYLCENLYLRNCNCRAILCHDDYNSRHVVRTLLCRQHDIMSLGVQHSAANGLYTVPLLAYICFDKYLIWGKFYENLFGSFWSDLDLVEFGYNRIEGFLQQLNAHKENPANTKTPIYKNRRKNVLITLPTIISFDDFMNKFPNAIGMLDFLRDLDDSILSLANVYVRPKYLYEGIYDIRKYINNSSVQFLLEDSYTTTELLNTADFVVASNGSGVIVECSLLQKKVVTYDYFGCLKNNWSKFGDNMCIQDGVELQNVILAVLQGKSINVNWTYLWQDIAYRNAGESNQILKKIIEQCGTSPLKEKFDEEV